MFFGESDCGYAQYAKKQYHCCKHTRSIFLQPVETVVASAVAPTLKRGCNVSAGIVALAGLAWVYRQRKNQRHLFNAMPVASSAVAMQSAAEHPLIRH